MVKRITFGGYQGPNSVHTKGVQVFADAVTRFSDGMAEVIFERDITNRGVPAVSLFDMVERGEMDGFYFSSSYLTDRVPALVLLDQHFAVQSRNSAHAMLDGALGQSLADEVARHTGYIVLGYWDNGLRHISTVSDPIKRPEDCEGLILRTLASENHQRVFKSLGFNPVAVDVSDLADAVHKGQVDAQENPLTNTYQFDLYKSHRAITLTGHLLGVSPVFFNAKTFASWSPEIQGAVKAAVAQATVAQRHFAKEAELECAELMRNDGVQMVSLSPEQRLRFRAKIRHEVDATRVGLRGDLIEQFNAAVAAQSGGQK